MDNVIFDDGEFVVTLHGNEAMVMSMGHNTGKWLLSDSEISRIKMATNSDEVVSILNE